MSIEVVQIECFNSLSDHELRETIVLRFNRFMSSNFPMFLLPMDTHTEEMLQDPIYHKTRQIAVEFLQVTINNLDPNTEFISDDVQILRDGEEMHGTHDFLDDANPSVSQEIFNYLTLNNREGLIKTYYEMEMLMNLYTDIEYTDYKVN